MQESRKTRYTKMVLRQALIEKLKTKPISQVTVTELCEWADLSRGTFYLHYANPAELFEHLEDDLFARFATILRDKADADDYDLGLAFLRELAANRDETELILKQRCTLLERILVVKRERSQRMCRERFPDLDDRQRDYVRIFKEQGTIHLITAWVKGGMVEKPEQIANLLVRMM